MLNIVINPFEILVSDNLLLLSILMHSLLYNNHKINILMVMAYNNYTASEFVYTYFYKSYTIKSLQVNIRYHMMILFIMKVDKGTKRGKSHAAV